MSSSRTALGIDIGGTKIAVGSVTESGEILRRVVVPTPAREGGAMNIRAVTAAAEEIGAEAVAVGVGTAGIVDRSGTVAASTDLLADWVGTDISGQLAAGLSTGSAPLPIAVLNDVQAHAVGEARVGAGQGAGSVLVVAVGTGLGGALVQDGTPLVGAHGAAGHLGHVPSPAAGDLTCSCGRGGHLEAVASGYGVLQLYRASGGRAAVADARAVGALTVDDPVARDVVRISGRALGSAIGSMINILDPEVVVLSGGLTNLGEAWWSAVRAGARSTVLPYLDSVRLVSAKRGDDAAIIGAALVAFDQAGAAR